MRPLISTHLLTLAMAVSSLTFGCGGDIDVNNIDSATDADDVLTDSGADSPHETSGPGAEPFDPLDHCALHPDETFEGTVHRCDGSFSSSIRFDYYGDPDLGIEKFIVCLDFSEDLDTEPGYVSTCFVPLQRQPFGEEGVDVDTCCFPDSPEEAVLPLCRIDAAEELCEGSAEKLNELRMSIPKLLKLAELNKQLYSLNKHMATSPAQTDCSYEFAVGLVEAGNFGGIGESIRWTPGNNYDPDTGWRWIRNINLSIVAFHIDETVDTHHSCSDKELLEEIEGEILPAPIVINGELGVVTGSLRKGRFTLQHNECLDRECPAHLEMFDFDVDDFELGGIKVSDVHVSLSEGANGTVKGSHLKVPARNVRLSVTGRASTSSPVLGMDLGAYLDGTLLSLDLRASADMTAVLGEDELAVTALEVDTWPVFVRIGNDES